MLARGLELNAETARCEEWRRIAHAIEQGKRDAQLGEMDAREWVRGYCRGALTVGLAVFLIAELCLLWRMLR